MRSLTIYSAVDLPETSSKGNANLNCIICKLNSQIASEFPPFLTTSLFECVHVCVCVYINCMLKSDDAYLLFRPLLQSL